MMTEKKRHTRHGHMARVSKLALGDHALPVRFMYKRYQNTLMILAGAYLQAMKQPNF